MKTVFLVLPRRISVRYTLSAGLLDYFKNRQDIRLVILTSVDDQKFRKEFASDTVLVEYIPMLDDKELWLERALRQMRNYLGGVGQDIDTFRMKAKMRGLVFYSIYGFLTYLLRPLLFLRTFLRFLDTRLVSAWVDRKYVQLFKKYQPDSVIIHSIFELTAVPVARVASRFNIPTLGVVFSWDNLGNKGEIYARCDKLVVWNKFMLQHATRYHQYLSQNVIVSGPVQFDYHINLSRELESREDFFLRKGLNPEKQLILFTTTPLRIGGQAEIKAIRTIYESICAKALPDCQLLVRIYNKDNPRRYDGFVGLDDLILDDVGKNLLSYQGAYQEIDMRFELDLLASMKYADVCVNTASSTTLDAVCFGTPVVNLALEGKNAWNLTTHYKDVIATGGTRVALTFVELIGHIKRYLADKSLDGLERNDIITRIIGTLDGQNIRRQANIFLEFIDDHASVKK